MISEETLSLSCEEEDRIGDNPGEKTLASAQQGHCRLGRWIQRSLGQGTKSAEGSYKTGVPGNIWGKGFPSIRANKQGGAKQPEENK